MISISRWTIIWKVRKSCGLSIRRQREIWRDCCGYLMIMGKRYWFPILRMFIWKKIKPWSVS